MTLALKWTSHLYELLGFAAASCGKVPSNSRKHTMATPNYGFDKRQKELAKKKKKEEKLRTKAERKVGDTAEDGTPEDAAEESTGESDSPA